MVKTHQRFNESDLPRIAQAILESVSAGSIITLRGQLAAGKTRLTQSLLAAMGYQSEVNSPTFVIEHRYPVKYKNIQEVIHLDLYRLTKNDLSQLDWPEYLNSTDKLVIIEWPEIAKKQLSTVKEKIFPISLKVINNHEREISY